MDRMVLKAEKRSPLTRGELNRLRCEGKVPAVIYGRGKETQSLLVDGRILRQALAREGTNVLIDLQMEEKAGPQSETVMLKEIQRHLWRQEMLLHVDFIRISMEDEIEVEIPLSFTGEAAGASEGGILQFILRVVGVRCLPGNIPEFIEVDISSLHIGEGISAAALTLPEGVRLLVDPEETLVQMLAPVEEEKEELPDAEEEEIEGKGTVPEEGERADLPNKEEAGS